MINFLISGLSNNGLKITGGSFAGGFLSSLMKNLCVIKMQDFLDWFQLIAFAATIVVAICTLYSYKVTGKFNKPKPKNNGKTD